MPVQGYKSRDYRRACDICGGAAWFSEMKYIGQNRWACDMDAPGLTAEQISRHNARVRPLVVKSHKHPKQRAETPDYKLTEAQFFDIAVRFGATNSFTDYNDVIAWSRTATSFQPQALGSIGIYLADLISEGERPTSWITRATTTLRAVGNAIVALQYGSPTGPSPSEAVNSVLYGMVTSGGSTSAQPWGASLMGVALMRCYALFGDQAYLDAATRLAYWFRSMQTLRNLGATNVYNGGFSSQLTTSKSVTPSCAVSDTMALWFLSEYAAVVGASATVGAAAGGDFIVATTGTLQTMMADARGFYAGGTTGGIAMLSATTPYDNYSLTTGLFGLSNSSYSGNSTVISTLFSINVFLIGLRGLYAYEGYSATVASIYEWLMSTASSAGSEPTAGQSQASIDAGMVGVFDPDLALPLQLQVKDSLGNATNVSGISAAGAWGYDLAATGLLSPVRVASGRDMARFKTALCRRRRSRTDINNQPTSSRGATVDLLRTNSRVGFEMQSTPSGICNLFLSALTAMAFRYPPKTYPALKAG